MYACTGSACKAAKLAEAAADICSVQAAIKQMNSDFSLGQSAAPAPPAAAACQKRFAHWCLDGKHINRGGIIAIIVVGSVLVLAAIVAASVLAARRRTNKEVSYSVD